MRYNYKIIVSIIILITNLVRNTNSIINVSQSDPIVSVGQQNHITASDRPQHYSFCGEPPNVSNTVSNLMRNQKHNVFKVGEIAFYSCDIGFVRVSGKEETQCMASEGLSGPRWQPIDLICETVKCSDPGFVDNSSRKIMNEFRYNSNVNYECDPGFRMIGVPFLTCKADGNWNRVKPFCQKKQCPQLEGLENGRIVYSDAERRTDSKLEYVCNPGFKLNALSAVRYCRQDDSWSDLLEMNHTLFQCLVIRCDSPVRPHSGLRIISSRPKSGRAYKPGDVIIFTCDTSPKTKATSKCLPDGQWSRGPPHCPEIITSCPPIGDFAHGFYNMSNSSNKDLKSFKSNTKIGFYCFQNHILEGTQSLTCLSTGVWSATIPKCTVSAAIIDSQSSKLTILITSIAVLVVIVFVVSCVVVCRWRQQQLQRRRWQQYFGHYSHRQSKTNIVLNSNEMKCFRQTPPKPTVPVTDL